ncbi:MAG: ubiquinol-cytochrome c reductase iron-sulfur subunit [Chloroflexi bacterium]|nr:ubiquinol-cytochrome c reductase iron-sulfur subunit [Chloroflexota bacterium]
MSEIRNYEDFTRTTRRKFLRNSVAAVGGLVTAGIAVPVVGYFISPALKKADTEWVAIATVNDIPKDTPTPVDYVVRANDGWTTVEVRKACWAVTKDGEDFTVFDPRCTHLGCAYHWDEGKKLFLCPCHNAVFDIDGKVVSGPPPRALDRFETKIVGNKLFIGKSSRPG